MLKLEKKTGTYTRYVTTPPQGQFFAGTVLNRTVYAHAYNNTYRACTVRRKPHLLQKALNRGRPSTCMGQSYLSLDGRHAVTGLQMLSRPGPQAIMIEATTHPYHLCKLSVGHLYAGDICMCLATSLEGVASRDWVSVTARRIQTLVVSFLITVLLCVSIW